MKTIGFADYYLDEWHANNYPAWIEEANNALGEDFKLCFAYGKTDSPSGMTGAEWCEKFGVTECKSIEELCEKSDYVFILAPSDPDKHLEFAEKVLPFGKPTYIDKTFAPDYETAKKIYAVGEKYSTPFFSTSALRFATELNGINATDIIVTGGGRKIDEYIIHQVEMAVTLLGVGAKSAQAVNQGSQSIISVTYGDDRKATFIYDKSIPFSITVQTLDGEHKHLPIRSPFFNLLIKEILIFFKTKKSFVEKEQTLEVMRIRDGILKAVEHEGTIIDI